MGVIEAIIAAVGGTAVIALALFVKSWFSNKARADQAEAQRDAEKERANRTEAVTKKIQEVETSERTKEEDLVRKIDAITVGAEIAPVSEAAKSAVTLRNKLWRLRNQVALPAVTLGAKLGKHHTFIVGVEVGGELPTVAEALAWGRECGANQLELKELEILAKKAGAR